MQSGNGKGWQTPHRVLRMNLDVVLDALERADKVRATEPHVALRYVDDARKALLLLVRR